MDTKAERPGTLWERISRNFRKPPVSNNPKLVNFLAAGSIQGLRPLRYERRVANFERTRGAKMAERADARQLAFKTRKPDEMDDVRSRMRGLLEGAA